MVDISFVGFYGRFNIDDVHIEWFVVRLSHAKRLLLSAAKSFSFVGFVPVSVRQCTPHCVCGGSVSACSAKPVRAHTRQ